VQPCRHRSPTESDRRAALFRRADDRADGENNRRVTSDGQTRLERRQGVVASRDEECATVIPEQWEQIKSVFDGALRHRPGSRADYLEEACAGNATQRAEAEALLAAYDEADSLIDHPAIKLGWSAPPGLPPQGECLQDAGAIDAPDEEFRGTTRF